MEIVLKENTSLQNPTFIIESSTLPTWNMCSFAGRYYFINPPTSLSNNLWELSGTVDVLASYKAEILQTSAFVMYSSSQYSFKVVDPRMINEAEVVVTKATAELPGTMERPWYFLGVIGNRTKKVSGFMDYYVMDNGEMTALSEVFYDNTVLLDELKQYFTEPMSAIVSCKAGTIKPFTTGSVEIYLGNYATGIDSAYLGSSWNHSEVTLDVPFQYTDFRRLPPFTQLSIFLPYVGMVPISASELLGSEPANVEMPPTQLIVGMTFDFVTGEVVYTLERVDRERIGLYVGQFLYDVPVSQIQQNTGAILGGVLEMTTSALSMGVSGSASGSGVAGVASGFANAMGGALSRTPSMTGGTGGSAMSYYGYKNIELYCYSYRTRNDFTNMREIAGCANMQVTPLAALTGYCQTNGASVAGTMTDVERLQINQMLDGGVYIE